jgi:hypothetical protein
VERERLHSEAEASNKTEKIWKVSINDNGHNSSAPRIHPSNVKINFNHENLLLMILIISSF